MSQQTPVAVAAQRLLEKQQNVKEQLRALEGTIESLAALDGELEARMQRALSQVDVRLSTLMQLVEHKKNQMVLSLKEDVAIRRRMLEEYRTKALEVVNKAKEVSLYKCSFCVSGAMDNHLHTACRNVCKRDQES